MGVEHAARKIKNLPARALTILRIEREVIAAICRFLHRIHRADFFVRRAAQFSACLWRDGTSGIFRLVDVVSPAFASGSRMLYMSRPSTPEASFCALAVFVGLALLALLRDIGGQLSPAPPPRRHRRRRPRRPD